MVTHGKINQFDPSHEAWATYVEWLELYFIANGIEDPEKKRAVLLTVSGPTTYKLIRNLSSPKKPAEKSYDELVVLIKSHYTQLSCRGFSSTAVCKNQEKQLQHL